MPRKNWKSAVVGLTLGCGVFIPLLAIAVIGMFCAAVTEWKGNGWDELFIGDAVGLVLLGGLIAATNFHIAFLRYPLFLCAEERLVD